MSAPGIICWLRDMEAKFGGGGFEMCWDWGIHSRLCRSQVEAMMRGSRAGGARAGWAEEQSDVVRKKYARLHVCFFLRWYFARFFISDFALFFICATVNCATVIAFAPFTNSHNVGRPQRGNDSVTVSCTREATRTATDITVNTPRPTYAASPPRPRLKQTYATTPQTVSPSPTYAAPSQRIQHQPTSWYTTTLIEGSTRRHPPPARAAPSTEGRRSTVAASRSTYAASSAATSQPVHLLRTTDRRAAPPLRRQYASPPPGRRYEGGAEHRRRATQEHAHE
ncbi:hypothetical protein C8J57DRAFT_1635711 [Mycena rebaudengoi]|nr:hypothetical protein C8J57DRAFT_1635711 [Mycena rebaudengoi]